MQAAACSRCRAEQGGEPGVLCDALEEGWEPFLGILRVCSGMGAFPTATGSVQCQKSCPGLTWKCPFLPRQRQGWGCPVPVLRFASAQPSSFHFGDGLHSLAELVSVLTHGALSSTRTGVFFIRLRFFVQAGAGSRVGCQMPSVHSHRQAAGIKQPRPAQILGPLKQH